MNKIKKGVDKAIKNDGVHTLKSFEEGSKHSLESS